jgi:CRISPR-associated exonuclease Cas4
MFPEAELIPISALQHWAFCPRQCGLIHLEGLWEENRLTAQGRLLHEKAHEERTESRGRLRIERGLPLRSLSLGITGKADVVEFHQEASAWRPFPVEYKRGRPKMHDADRIQLCAQAVCLEEMLQTAIPFGALFYGAKRRREEVALGPQLRAKLQETVRQVRAMFTSGQTPPPSPAAHCRSCSLQARCLPKHTAPSNSAARYLKRQIALSLGEV